VFNGPRPVDDCARKVEKELREANSAQEGGALHRSEWKFRRTIAKSSTAAGVAELTSGLSSSAGLGHASAAPTPLNWYKDAQQGQ
jgi:hypothetical protein